MRNLCRLGALVLMLSLPSFSGPTSELAPAAREARATSDVTPGETSVGISVSGGSVLICVLSGILFGASVLTGNTIGAAASVVTAIENGCL